MEQYECRNVPQVQAKIRELTNTAMETEENAFWRDCCYRVKRDTEHGLENWGSVSDVSAFTENGEETEVRVCVGYDAGTRTYLVWIEEE